MERIDPASPVPLYHQIAEAIRERIEAGELAAGDALEPLREAAERWGVNLHTVRHAYTALARDGLVETRGTRGTRVAKQPAIAGRAQLADFLAGIVREGRERFGLDRRALVEALARPDSRPVVWVVECSEWQCQSHCAELGERYDVDARPWSLEREGEPGEGVALATYFHYNDIRRRWPDRLRAVRFVTITPDPALAGLLKPEGVRVVVHERDEETARNIAADVAHEFGGEVEVVFGPDPRGAMDRLQPGSVMLLAPRVWAELDERARSHPFVHEVRYVFDPRELAGIADELGWAPRSMQGAGV